MSHNGDVRIDGQPIRRGLLGIGIDEKNAPAGRGECGGQIHCNSSFAAPAFLASNGDNAPHRLPTLSHI
jgi:hypothetical protein